MTFCWAASGEGVRGRLVRNLEAALDGLKTTELNPRLLEGAETQRIYRSRAVERAIETLGVLAERPEGATLAELSRVTRVPASTLLGILGSLSVCRLVRADEGRYALDIGVLELGQAYSEGVDLIERFFPIGRRLCAALDETVQLGVLSGASAVYIARHESTQPLRLVALVGRRLPAYASAVGKALMAQMEKSELTQLLGEEPFESVTERTLTTYGELGRELATARRRGFAESREECIAGLHCISAPVFDRTGVAVAAISVSAPRFRLDRARRGRIAGEVMRAATELSQALGAERLRAVEQAVS